MKSYLFVVLLCSQLLFCNQNLYAQGNIAPGASPNPPNVGQFDASLLKNPQDFISVKRNKFVDEDGKTFVFYGMSIADPHNLEQQKKWNKQLFEVIHSWGANTVRLPIHPSAWRARGQQDYFKLLDQAVLWANEYNLYLIIDWHSIGYLESGQYQHAMYFTDKRETFRFWHEIAWRYQHIPTTAVYELFNEPTTLEEPWNKETWLQWRESNEQMIDIIYALDNKVIPLVAGFNWAYDLSYAKKYPVRREGVAYASHPYPQKEQPHPPTEENFHRLWEKNWGHVSKRYPMILSEIGWVQPDGYGAHIPVKNDGSYGPQMLAYTNKKGLSWIAWVFDPVWSPTMINNWNFEPSEQGVFWRDRMLELRAEEQP